VLHPESLPSSSLKTAAQLLASLEQRRQQSCLETRVPVFDRLGGLARGSLLELSGPRSSGRFALALAALAAATRQGEAAAFVDLGDHLEPKSAAAAGLDLRRLLWVRPRTLKESVMSAEMVLAAGFAVVVLDLGSRILPLHRLPPSVWMRLARAAEAHNNALLLLSPTPLRPPEAAAWIQVSGGHGVWSPGPARDAGPGTAPHAAGGSAPLLCGIAARLSLTRRRGQFQQAEDGLSLGVRDHIEGGESA
jgi:hypothetical protein